MNNRIETPPAKTLLPHKLAVAKGKPFVHWADPTDIDLTFGFFRDSISTLPDGDRNAAMSTLTSIQQDRIAPQLSQRCKGLIFHCGRCGSTLLCQMLKQHPDLLVVGEPAIIGAVLMDSTLTDDERHRYLAGVFNAYLAWAKAENRFLVFKLSSWQLQHWTQICNVLPMAPRVLLHREPLAVVDSMIRRPPSWLLKRQTETLDDPEHVFEHSPKALLSKACSAYTQFAEHAVSFLNASGSLGFDYEALRPGIGELLAFFDLPHDKAILSQMLEQTQFAAKRRASGRCQKPPVAYQHRPAEHLTQTKFRLGNRWDVLQDQYAQVVSASAKLSGRLAS